MEKLNGLFGKLFAGRRARDDRDRLTADVSRLRAELRLAQLQRAALEQKCDDLRSGFEFARSELGKIYSAKHVDVVVSDGVMTLTLDGVPLGDQEGTS